MYVHVHRNLHTHTYAQWTWLYMKLLDGSCPKEPSVSVSSRSSIWKHWLTSFVLCVRWGTQKPNYRDLCWKILFGCSKQIDRCMVMCSNYCWCTCMYIYIYTSAEPPQRLFIDVRRLEKHMKFVLFLQRGEVPIMKHCFNLEKDLKVKFELSRKIFRAWGLDHVVFACPNMSC